MYCIRSAISPSPTGWRMWYTCVWHKLLHTNYPPYHAHIMLISVLICHICTYIHFIRRYMYKYSCTTSYAYATHTYDRSNPLIKHTGVWSTFYVYCSTSITFIYTYLVSYIFGVRRYVDLIRVKEFHVMYDSSLCTHTVCIYIIHGNAQNRHRNCNCNCCDLFFVLRSCSSETVWGATGHEWQFTTSKWVHVKAKTMLESS